MLFCGLLIGTVIFLVFFPHQSRTLFKPILPFPATLHENTSHHHVLVAGDIIESMDASVDPCDDFYSFSCNGWINKHPLPRVVIILFLPFLKIFRYIKGTGCPIWIRWGGTFWNQTFFPSFLCWNKHVCILMSTIFFFQHFPYD